MRHGLLVQVDRCSGVNQEAASVTHSPEDNNILAGRRGLHVQSRDKARQVLESCYALLLNVLTRERLHHHRNILR